MGVRFGMVSDRVVGVRFVAVDGSHQRHRRYWLWWLMLWCFFFLCVCVCVCVCVGVDGGWWLILWGWSVVVGCGG